MRLALADHVNPFSYVLQSAVAADDTCGNSERAQHKRQAAGIAFAMPFLDIQEKVGKRVHVSARTMQVEAVAKLAGIDEIVCQSERHLRLGGYGDGSLEIAR